MLDPKLVAKYIKVWAIAEMGTGGDQASAKKRMEAMGEKYPGIHNLAVRVRNYSSGQSLPPEEDTGVNSWETLREVAAAALDLFGSYTAAQSGAHALQRARPFTEQGFSDSGKPRTRLGLEFGIVTLRAVRMLDAGGQEGFRHAAHQLLDEALSAFLEYLEAEGDESEL